MKVLLLNPWQPATESSKENLSVAWPLNVLSVAATTIMAGHRVIVLDAYLNGCVPFIMGENHTVCFTGNTVADKDAKQNTVLVGAPCSLIESLIGEIKPDVVGVSLTFSSQNMLVGSLVASIKRAAPNATIVFGGSHATLISEVILGTDGVDYVVIGEGEIAFPTLLDALENNESTKDIPGVCYREGNQAIIPRYELIENLDALPFPPIHLIPFEAYFAAEGIRRMPMATSRGCPFHCRFCSVPLLTNRQWRAMSADRVVEEISYYVFYGVTDIQFIDDNMSLKKDRFVAILEGIIANKWGLNLHASQALHCSSLLDDETISLMQQAGFKRVFVSAESGNERVLKEEIGKTFTVGDAENAIRNIAKGGMEPAVNLVIGMPNEKWAEILDTAMFARKMKNLGAQQFWISIATPLPGTELWNEVVEKELLVPDIYKNYNYGDATFDGVDWKREDLLKLRAELMEELNR